MTTSTTLRVLAALALTAALAGCGGSGSSAETSGSGGDAAASEAVTIDDLAFSPAELTVSAGSEVTWTNDDEAPHTVTFEDDTVDSSDEMDSGDSFTATFDEPGAYSYICAIHPDMKGTVTVS